MAAAPTVPSAHRPPQKLYDLHVTIVSAKHLKNVNWRNGDLNPYVILWVDPDRRHSTRPDDSGSTRPVWNERFVLPLTSLSRDSTLTLEIFHSKPSDTPKPLVGALRFEIRHLLADPETRLRTLEVKRPSGRPHGKIRLKLDLLERPIENYQTAPPPPLPPSYYYQTAPNPTPAPPPPAHNYNRGYMPYFSVPPPPPPQSLSPQPSPPLPYSYGGYSDHPHSGYYPAAAHYSQPQPQPMFERQSSYGGPGPSAPVELTPYDYYRRNSGKLGAGAGALAGALGGLGLDEETSSKYEEHKIEENEELVVSSSRDKLDNHYAGSDYKY